MQTKKIGQILAEERQRQRVTLQQLAEQTQIKLVYLKALESSQFDQLPPAPFVKGFIKSYARVFNLDAKSLLALLRRDYHEDQQGSLIPQEMRHSSSKKRQFWRPVTLVVLLAAVVFLTLFSYVGWQWYNLNRPPRLIIHAPKESEFVSSQIEVRGLTDPEAIVTVNAQPVSLQPDGSFFTEFYLPKEGISTITIEAIDQRGKVNMQQRTVYVKF